MSDEQLKRRLAPEVPQPSCEHERGRTMPVSGEREPLVLTCGSRFCVTNQRGDISPAGARDLGLYYDDTRHLSYFELFVAGGPPLGLSAHTQGASTAQIDLTLTDRQFGGFLSDPQNFLHIRRKRLLDDDWVEQIVLTNYLARPVDLWAEVRMAADFVDIFEARGMQRRRRGALLPPRAAADQLVFGYHGLDGQEYRTIVRMVPEPRRTAVTGPFWELSLSPGESAVLELVLATERGPMRARVFVPHDVRMSRIEQAQARYWAESARVRCNNMVFEDALRNSFEDLGALRQSLGTHEIVAAGVPWFAAPFGRDALIAARQTLSVRPALAGETLRALAACQGEKEDLFSEEEPGKIMHELRRGEMARTHETPHFPYYGFIDSTPLWLMLLGETYKWTGDRRLLDELLPNAERALGWIEQRLASGGGLVRYQRMHESGLENQGWKDSRDGVPFPDGRLAVTPIALVEVQGYAAGAITAMADVVAALGDAPRSGRLRAQAATLTEAIDTQFWVEPNQFYALAIDGEGHKVPTLTSNPGHLPACCAIDQDRARLVVERLISDELYSGYGVRTLGRGQPAYNPLSYHNGSVWPHDTALCALSASRVGRPDISSQLLDGLYQAARHFRRYRLPELFCGLGRGTSDFLVHYPVACSPQSWAAGSLFLLLEAVLGIRPDAPRQVLSIVNPLLPSFVDWLDIVDLRVGASRLTLHFARHGTRTHADLVEISGAPLKVRIELD